MRTLILALLSVPLAWNPAARADPTLDAKLAKLYTEVARSFRPVSAPGLPTSTMMAEDLFAIAMKSYCGLMESPDGNQVTNPDRFSMVDFNQSPKVARLYVYDVARKRIIRNTWTSHGSGSDYMIHRQVVHTGLNKMGPNHEVIYRYAPEAPLFFSNVPESEKTSIGMAIAEPNTYYSTKTYGGVPQGHSVRLKGVDGRLNDKIHGRGIVIHGYEFNPKEFAEHGAPNSQGCVMIERDIAADVMNEMMGGPVMLYHDRLFPEMNEEAYRAELAQVSKLEREISSNLRALGQKYGWSPNEIARAEAKLKAEIAPLRGKFEATYRYFKPVSNDITSRYITLEPIDPVGCAKRLGI